MSRLPVIVGFGGINPAGRASCHRAYIRLLIDKLSQQTQIDTLTDLATLTNRLQYLNGTYTTADGKPCLPIDIKESLLKNTLVRQIDAAYFNVKQQMFNRPATLNAEQPLQFFLRKRQMPVNIPKNWTISEYSQGKFAIKVEGEMNVILPDYKEALVQTAGQIPTGFEPGKLYPSRNHPRNLQLSIFAASDAIYSMGIDFSNIIEQIPPDQIAVYASNSIGQLDDFGFGGLTKYPALGKRTTSKQMPLGYAQMPADFVNAYILGNVGSTSGALGACATFLYNLNNAVNDIQSGRRKFVLVGGSDAPVTPEIIEGFRTMGALAEDKDLRALNNKTELTASDYRSACRPFGENCGFVIGESSQFIALMSDDLAIELGANIYGAIPKVFINADGYKKSISAPGIGNYISLGKTAAFIRSMLGEKALQQRSFIQAHGTGTPQNRVTESHVINETAKAFKIQNLPVCAIKSYLGHSQGTAAGDQLNISLGVWKYGFLPGITTTPEFAEDVHKTNLHFSNQHLEVGSQEIDVAILNSKGFGGNNASSFILAPHVVRRMLEKRYSKDKLLAFDKQNEITKQAVAEYDSRAIQGNTKPIYRYDHKVLQGEHLEITDQEIKLPNYKQAINLNEDNPFEDIC